jgi:predicted transcriptional regulator
MSCASLLYLVKAYKNIGYPIILAHELARDTPDARAVGELVSEVSLHKDYQSRDEPRRDGPVLRKRSRLETLNVMLQLARSGIRKTHIMQRANVSHTQLNKYLDILMQRQLVVRERELYVTTARGQYFITTFQKIQAILGEVSEPRPSEQHFLG